LQGIPALLEKKEALLKAKIYAFCINNPYIAIILFLMVLSMLALELMLKPTTQKKVGDTI